MIATIIRNITPRLDPNSNLIAYFGTKQIQLQRYLETRNVKDKENYIYIPKDIFVAGRSFKAYIIDPSLTEED